MSPELSLMSHRAGAVTVDAEPPVYLRDAAITTMRRGILSTVGNTPLIRLERLLPNRGVQIYGKLEFLNPGGSIKDRTALTMVQAALDTGELAPGDRVIESSSGNMAIGLAQICRYQGLRLTVVVDPKLNEATARILAAYGAEVDVVGEPLRNGGFLGARLQRVEQLMSERREAGRNFWPNQYRNEHNPIAHWATMREIVEDLGEVPDYVFVATSTCGTLMGCADYLRSISAATRVVAVDAVGSVIFGGTAGQRKIPGHGAGCRSHFLDPAACHSVLHVSDRDCVEGCHRLMEREAILAGGSSGGVACAVERYFSNYSDLEGLKKPSPSCVLILCDRGERYLKTVYNEKWVTKNIPLEGGR